MPSKADHVRIGKEGETDILQCLHCGDVLRYQLPLRIETWTTMAKSFVKQHRNCSPKAETLESSRA